MSLMNWSAQRSGARHIGRLHDAGGVEAILSMAWVPGCIQDMCQKAPRCSFRIVFVRGGCSVQVSTEAFVT